VLLVKTTRSLTAIMEGEGGGGMNGGGRGGTTVITTTLSHGSDSPEEIDAAVEKATRGHGVTSATSASVAAVAADTVGAGAVVTTVKRARKIKDWIQVGLVETKHGNDLKTHVMQLTHQAAMGIGSTYTNNGDGVRIQCYTCAVGRCCPWMARTRTPTTGEIVVEVSGEHHHVDKRTPEKRRRREKPPENTESGQPLEGTAGGRNEAREGQEAEKESMRRLPAEAQAAAAKAKADAEKQADEMRRDLVKDRSALDREKAATEKAHAFQTRKILLDVGGHKFTTSRQTLVSVPDTYLASLFSGRYELTPDDKGAYFIDRDGTHFRHILNHLRDSGSVKLSSGVVAAAREELAVEASFYGLLDSMLPYRVQERVGHLLLQRACLAGTKREIQAAVSQARALVFDFGSTTPFLIDTFQNLRFAITDRMVNSSPVWATEGGEWLMFRSHVIDSMMIGPDCNARLNSDWHCICNDGGPVGSPVVAPTDMCFDQWISNAHATLDPQFASAGGSADNPWVHVPDMHITAVHGLDEGDPTMAAALRQLAALT
jgi:hypothetical protein